jgi:uncharacterized delta-60 repeat protein
MKNVLVFLFITILSLMLSCSRSAKTTSSAESSSFIVQLGAVTSFSGGDSSGNDQCQSVATDSDGNIYCAGSTTGALGETNGGGQDAFVMKLNSAGSTVWITQLGATTTATGGDNSGDDSCYGVAVDSDGNVYCAGFTSGALGEGNGGSNDIFVLKLNSSGALQWATQLGDTTVDSGGNNNGMDHCMDVAVDSSGNVYCSGYTSGAVGESNGGSSDVVLVKLNSAGALQWVTQLGGTTVAAGGDNSGGDYCEGVAFDVSGNVYCSGVSYGGLGEANGGNGDVFVMKVNSAGSLQWVTQLGGATTASGGDNSGIETGFALTLDTAANIYVAGYSSGALGESNGGSKDAIVMKLNSAGTLQWVTQLGATTKISDGDNSGDDQCRSIAVDSANSVYCVGDTSGAIGEASGGGLDVFLLKLNTSGELQWLTQLGDTTAATGGDNSASDTCQGAAMAPNNITVYCSGYTGGSFGESSGGSNDAFILRVSASTGSL